MKLQRVKVEAMWRIAVFFTNSLRCARGYNQICKYFDLPPPTLEDFLETTMNAYYNHTNLVNIQNFQT